MVEKNEGEPKALPVRFDNVVMKIGGVSLRGVTIRPLKESENGNERNVPDLFLVMTADSIDRKKIELIIYLDDFERILDGEEVELEGGFYDPWAGEYLGSLREDNACTSSGK